jgi:hypothetical protein
LKKGAQPATGQTKTNGNSGGVVPPPGLNLPPPPGMAPAQPAIPNAADDPFGAMNAMAAVGKVQRAPEIVIVNDGKPVENVGSKSMGATIAKIAVPAVVALIAGVAVGKIGTKASAYNAGLSDLREVLGESTKPTSVLGLKAQLVEVRKVLEEWREANKWKPSRAMEAKLEKEIAKLDLKAAVWFKDKGTAEPEIAGKVYSFYGGVAEVRNLFTVHSTLARDDDRAFTKAGKYAGLEEFMKVMGDAAKIPESENALIEPELAFRYGVVVHVPTDKDQTPFHAKIVEIGPPFCGGDGNPTSGKCPDNKPLAGFAYRTEPSGSYKQAPLAKSAGDIAADSLVLTFPNGVRDSLVKGAGAVASDAYYTKRLTAIYERVHGKPEPNDPERKPVGGLIEEGNKLESAIKTLLDQNKERFTFFM